MDLTQTILELKENTSKLVERFTTQADKWDQQVKNLVNEGKTKINNFIAGARGEYPASSLLLNPYFNLEDKGFPKYWELNNASWNCNHSFGLGVSDLTYELVPLAPVGDPGQKHWDSSIKEIFAKALGIPLRRCGALVGSMKILVFHGKTRTECHSSFHIRQRIFNYSKKAFSGGAYVYCDRWDLVDGARVDLRCNHARWGSSRGGSIRYNQGNEGVIKVTKSEKQSVGIRGITIGVKFKKTSTPENFTFAIAAPWLVCGYADDFVPPAIPELILNQIGG
jgi:hypothetical protein